MDTNELFSLPSEIGSLVQLEKLSASNNQLKSLPSTISRLKQMKSLHLANNQVNVILIF
ncbi:unnamed protein product [Trichobilharzia regenti]|nr:unnamed protein product [Trichobilharzia regenti]